MTKEIIPITGPYCRVYYCLMCDAYIRPLKVAFEVEEDEMVCGHCLEKLLEAE